MEPAPPIECPIRYVLFSSILNSLRIIPRTAITSFALAACSLSGSVSAVPPAVIAPNAGPRPAGAPAGGAPAGGAPAGGAPLPPRGAAGPPRPPPVPNLAGAPYQPPEL